MKRPGSATGATIVASRSPRPRKRPRAIAHAAGVPTSATTASMPAPTIRLFSSALTIFGSWSAVPYQCPASPRSGKLRFAPELNEKSTMIATGSRRNASAMLTYAPRRMLRTRTLALDRPHEPPRAVDAGAEDDEGAEQRQRERRPVRVVAELRHLEHHERPGHRPGRPADKLRRDVVAGREDERERERGEQAPADHRQDDPPHHLVAARAEGAARLEPGDGHALEGG